MPVYDSWIEIWMMEASDKFEERSEELVLKLRALRKLYPVSRYELCDEMTQESAFLDLLWRRACVSTDRWGSNGYVGAYQNCVFNLLYGVFGADIIAFLFDQSWIPTTRIDPFRPDVYLHRLSVLERAVQELKEGTKTPVPLPETTPYFRSGMGPRLNRFSEQHHRLLLESSLRELRDFGELGLLEHSQNERSTVNIHIVTCYEGWPPDVMEFSEGDQTQFK